MFISLEMILTKHIPPLKEQIVRKAVNYKESFIDLLDSSYLDIKLDLFEQILNIAAKGLAFDATKRLAKLNQDASSCVRAISKSMSSFI